MNAGEYHSTVPKRPASYGIAVLVVANTLTGITSETLGRQAATASTQKGLRLLHQLQHALGGAEKIAAIRDYEETIRAQAFDASGTSLGAVRKRTRWMRRPNVVRLDQRGPRGTYVLFFDGGSDSGSEILPDLQGSDPYKTSGTAIDLAGGELQFARGYLSGFELNTWLGDQMPGYRITASSEHVLRIEHATDFTLDAATSLPVKAAGISLADPDRPVATEMRFAEWRDASGVRFPARRLNYHSGVKRGEATTADIRVNAGLRAADLAAKPADFAPDIPRR